MPRATRVNILTIPVGSRFSFDYGGMVFERVASSKDGVWIKPVDDHVFPAYQVDYPQLVNPVNHQESDARS